MLSFICKLNYINYIFKEKKTARLSEALKDFLKFYEENISDSIHKNIEELKAEIDEKIDLIDGNDEIIDSISKSFISFV